MARVFVSHAHEDLAVAVTIRDWLRQEGHQVFLDRDLAEGIQVGEEWKRRLHRELRAADAVVCVVTAAYNASQWCAAEVGVADVLGCPLLPVRVGYMQQLHRRFRQRMHPPAPGRLGPRADSALLDGLQYIDLGANEARARDELVERLRGVDAAGGVGWPDGRSPFPGLAPFDVGMARVFCGRAEDVRQVTRRLRSLGERAEGGLLLVVGPSGCGKSSLVRAGLLARMAGEAGWELAVPFVPGRFNPVAALGWALADTANQAGLGWTAEYARRVLDEGPDGLVRLAEKLLMAGKGRARERLLLVVDQGEELLTRSKEPDRSAFVTLLREGLAGPVRVVMTLRSEYQDPLLALPELAGVEPDVFPLRPLGAHMLRRVIEEPAKAAGLAVDPELVEQLVADTVDGEALPLLAFTLNELANELTRGDKLSADRYAVLGGVKGALAGQADAALADASTASGLDREEVLAALVRLATLDASGKPTRRRVELDLLDKPMRAAADVFVNRRLLTISAESGGGDERVRVGVAHEALFTEWPPLATALGERATVHREARAVEAAAVEWRRNDESEHFLWDADRLDVTLAALELPSASLGQEPEHAERLLGGRGRSGERTRADVLAQASGIDEGGRRFLHACADRAQAVRRRERRTRTRTLSGLSVLLVLAVASAVATALLAADQRQRAATARETAVAVRFATGADAVRGSDPRLALQLGIAAHALSPDRTTRLAAAASLLESLTNPHQIGGPLERHGRAVWSVAFSPDGRMLATGSSDRTAMVWDVANPARPRPLGNPLREHRGPVWSVAFAPDGATLATGSDDGTVRLWDVADPTDSHPRGAPLAGHGGPVRAVVFSPHGTILAVAESDGVTTLWDVADPDRPRRLGEPLTGHTGPVLSAAFSRDGRTLATGGGDGTVRLWDVADPERPLQVGRPLEVSTRAVLSVAFSPRGTILATAGADDMVRLWDVADPAGPAGPRPYGDPVSEHTDWVRSVAFSPDGTMLATGSDDATARLWDVTDPAHPQPVGQPLDISTRATLSVMFSPRGTTLAAASADGTGRLWDVAPARPRLLGEPLQGHDGGVTATAFSPDGATLATGGEDASVRLWDATDPTRPRSLGEPLRSHIRTVRSVAFSPNGATLATASDDTTVRLWDATDPTRPRSLGEPLRGHIGPVRSVAFSPDGATLATASDDSTVRLWNVTAPARPVPVGEPLDAHAGPVVSVAFAAHAPQTSFREAQRSPERTILVTGSDDTTARLWDLTDPARPLPLGTPLEGHSSSVRSVVFSPNRTTLATGGDDATVRLWDVTDPARPRPLGTPVEGHADSVRSVLFSPDGSTLVTGGDDATVRLWNVADPANPRQLGEPLDGHTGPVVSAAFSPDGKTLAAGDDTTVQLRDVTAIADLRAHLVERACAKAGTGLDENTWHIYEPTIPYRQTCPA